MPLPNSAVYEIRNKRNNKRYVGSAAQLSKRWGNHKARLRRNNHHSIHLQRAWNKHGEEAFEFRILEVVEDLEKLVEREQAWMDSLRPAYNVQPRARSSLGHRHDEAFREMRRNMMKARGIAPALIEGSIRYRKGRPLSAEHRAKISAAQKGRPKSPTQRARCGIAQRELARRWYEAKSILIYGWALMMMQAECSSRMRKIRALQPGAEK